MDLNKKQILTTLLESIANVADEAYQRRVWIERKGPECEAFDDFVNYLNPECLDVIRKHKDFDITDEQYRILSKFQEEFDTFVDGDKYDDLPELFIDTSEWKQLVKRAQTVLKAFHYKKTGN